MAQNGTLASGQLAASDAAIFSATLYAASSIGSGQTYAPALLTLSLANTSASLTETIVITIQPGAVTFGGSTGRREVRCVLLPNETAKANIWVGPGDVLTGSTTDASTVDYTIQPSPGGPSFASYDATGAIKQSGFTAGIASTITSNSANALAVGPNGTTNPTLQIDASTSSAATGLKVKSAAAGAGVALVVISSGSDEALTINAKGTGTIGIGSVSTGAVTITPATTITGAATLSSTLAVTGAVTCSSTLSCTALTATSITATGTMAITNNVTITDAKNIILNASTGTKIATATTQKLGFWNATPVVQPVANTTDVSTTAAGGTSTVYLNTTFPGTGGTAAYTISAVVTALKAIGLLAP